MREVHGDEYAESLKMVALDMLDYIDMASDAMYASYGNEEPINKSEALASIDMYKTYKSKLYELGVEP